MNYYPIPAQWMRNGDKNGSRCGKSEGPSAEVPILVSHVDGKQKIMVQQN